MCALMILMCVNDVNLLFCQNDRIVYDYALCDTCIRLDESTYMGRYCPSGITFHRDIGNGKVNWWTLVVQKDQMNTIYSDNIPYEMVSQTISCVISTIITQWEMFSNQNRIIIVAVISIMQWQVMPAMTQDEQTIISLSRIATNLRVAETRGNDHARSKHE